MFKGSIVSMLQTCKFGCGEASPVQIILSKENLDGVIRKITVRMDIHACYPWSMTLIEFFGVIKIIVYDCYSWHKISEKSITILMCFWVTFFLLSQPTYILGQILWMHLLILFWICRLIFLTIIIFIISVDVKERFSSLKTFKPIYKIHFNWYWGSSFKNIIFLFILFTFIPLAKKFFQLLFFCTFKICMWVFESNLRRFCLVLTIVFKF